MQPNASPKVSPLSRQCNLYETGHAALKAPYAAAPATGATSRYLRSWFRTKRPKTTKRSHRLSNSIQVLCRALHWSTAYIFIYLYIDVALAKHSHEMENCNTCGFEPT